MLLLVRFLIRGYQLLVSPVLSFLGGPGSGCRFQPTCSVYFLEALERHGFFRGTWLGLRRLCRCHPWGGQGHDPVPHTSPADANASRRILFVNSLWGSAYGSTSMDCRHPLCNWVLSRCNSTTRNICRRRAAGSRLADAGAAPRVNPPPRLRSRRRLVPLPGRSQRLRPLRPFRLLPRNRRRCGMTTSNFA